MKKLPTFRTSEELDRSVLRIRNFLVFLYAVAWGLMLWAWWRTLTHGAHPVNWIFQIGMTVYGLKRTIHEVPMLFPKEQTEDSTNNED